MGDTPTTTNALASLINSVLKVDIVSVAPSLVIAAATAEIPWLALPVVKQIFSWLVNYLAGKFYVVVAQGSTATVITAQVAIEKKQMNDAMTALLNAQEGDDSDATQKALAAARAAFDRLSGFDGSAPA